MTTSRAGAAAGVLTPVPLMQLATGFWGAKVLAAGVELDLFGVLADRGSATCGEVAEALGCQSHPVDLLLSACASLGLLDKHGDRFRNSALADRFLVPGGEQCFGPFVRFLDTWEYVPWHRLTTAIRGNTPVTWDPEAHRSLFDAMDDPDTVRLFWDAMHAISTFTAATLGDVYDFTAHQRLLDVGGGSGAFPIVLCRRYPNLSATVWDLPKACGIAATKIGEAGMGAVIGAVAGDFHTEPLPTGYDVALLSNILHDWPEPVGRMLLGKCFDALVPGGAVVVCELLLNPERTGPAAAALMGLNMLVDAGQGRNYSHTELTGWLAAAGFTGVQVLAFDAAGANGALVARKP